MCAILQKLLPVNDVRSHFDEWHDDTVAQNCCFISLFSFSESLCVLMHLNSWVNFKCVWTIFQLLLSFAFGKSTF